jgi:hypothetical protein
LNLEWKEKGRVLEEIKITDEDLKSLKNTLILKPNHNISHEKTFRRFSNENFISSKEK